MAECIELIFEAIEKDQLPEFIKTLCKIGKIGSIKYVDKYGNQLINNIIEINNFEKSKLHQMSYIVIRFDFLTLGNIKLFNVDVWLNSDLDNSTNNIDLLILFEVLDLKEFMTKVPKLMEYACKLSKKFAINNYYCGFEPAIDKDTRFFTRDQIGPLKTIRAKFKTDE